MKRIAVVLFALAIAPAAQAADCDIGIYSRYVTGIGTVAGTHHEPALQGGCTKSFTNGLYVNAWGSQSLRDPGFDRTFANEFDLTAGWKKQLADKWSLETHVAYFDIANPGVLRLTTNGDVTNAGGRVTYQATKETSLYVLGEGYHGMGPGIAGGWKAGAGVATNVGPIAADAALLHNHNFIVTGGQFVRVSLETLQPLTKVAGGELRPVVMWYQPLGQYHKSIDTSVVFAVRINW